MKVFCKRLFLLVFYPSQAGFCFLPFAVQRLVRCKQFIGLARQEPIRCYPDPDIITDPVLSDYFVYCFSPKTIFDMFNSFAGFSCSPIGPISFFIFLLLCDQRIDNTLRRISRPPCPIQGQDYDVNPFLKIAGGFLNFFQLFFDMVNKTCVTLTRAECFFRPSSLVIDYFFKFHGVLSPL